MGGHTGDQRTTEVCRAARRWRGRLHGELSGGSSTSCLVRLPAATATRHGRDGRRDGRRDGVATWSSAVSAMSPRPVAHLSSPLRRRLPRSPAHGGGEVEVSGGSGMPSSRARSPRGLGAVEIAGLVQEHAEVERGAGVASTLGALVGCDRALDISAPMQHDSEVQGGRRRRRSRQVGGIPAPRPWTRPSAERANRSHVGSAPGVAVVGGNGFQQQPRNDVGSCSCETPSLVKKCGAEHSYRPGRPPRRRGRERRRRAPERDSRRRARGRAARPPRAQRRRVRQVTRAAKRKREADSEYELAIGRAGQLGQVPRTRLDVHRAGRGRGPRARARPDPRSTPPAPPAQPTPGARPPSAP